MASSMRLPSANVSQPAARPSCRHAANSTDESIAVTKNLIGGILDEILPGEGYGMASTRADAIIRKAVITGQTNGYGYGILAATSIVSDQLTHIQRA